MRRSTLKNIINKSKGLSNKPVGDPFDEFKKSLPIEIDNNYRLEAAWKAYGSPKNYQEALWQGMIQPIDETNVKLPSIGYNEETDEYEYLNSGKENETVAKDIRVWDNDVIPLVQELKQGGFIRVYDEEKNCWKYSKNKPQETLTESGEIIEEFKEGGKPKKVKSDLSYYNKDTDTIYYSGETKKDRKEAYKHEYVHARPDEYAELFDYLKPYYENLDDNKISELGGDLNFVKSFENDPNHFYNPEELVARVLAAKYRTRFKNYDPDFFKDLRQNENKYGDNMRDLLHMYNDENLSKIFSYFRKNGGFGGGFETQYYDPTGEFAHGLPLIKLGTDQSGNMIYRTLSGEEYLNPSTPLESFKQGGQMNVIPEAFKLGGAVIPSGSLHARKNHMELAEKGEITSKGIPVIDNDGNLQAEIEREEVIFDKLATIDIEKLYKKFNETDKESEKNELAIKAGKILTDIFINNTEDNTGLIEKVANKNNLEYNK